MTVPECKDRAELSVERPALRAVAHSHRSGEMSNRRWKLRALCFFVLVFILIGYIGVRRALNSSKELGLKELLLLNLKPGMTQKEVESILGKPISMETNNLNGQFVCWIYRKRLVFRLKTFRNPLDVIAIERANSMIVYFKRKRGSWLVWDSRL